MNTIPQRFRLALVAVPVFALMATACGGDDSASGENGAADEAITIYSGRDQELIDPLIDMMREHPIICSGQALGLLVPVSSTPHRASTSSLSTPSSTGSLTLSKEAGDLISKQASRLDAFSGYLSRT